MYPDLYEGLRLKPKYLVCYDSPLVGVDGKVVIPKGQIKLPVQAGSEMVDVNFNVVDAYSPYIAIVARPWLQALGAISSTLHFAFSTTTPVNHIGTFDCYKPCSAEAENSPPI